MGEDPARDGSNWYNYVNGNPLRFTDPTGLLDQASMFPFSQLVGNSGPNGFFGGISNDMVQMKGFRDSDMGYSNGINIGYNASAFSVALSSIMYTPVPETAGPVPGYSQNVISPSAAGAFYDPSKFTAMIQNGGFTAQASLGLNSPAFGGWLQNAIHEKVNGNIWGRDSLQNTPIVDSSVGVVGGSATSQSFAQLGLSMSFGYGGKGWDWSLDLTASIGARSESIEYSDISGFTAGMTYARLSLGTLPQFSSSSNPGVSFSGGFLGALAIPQVGSLAYGWTFNGNSVSPEVNNVVGDVYGTGYAGMGLVGGLSLIMSLMPAQYQGNGIPHTPQPSTPTYTPPPPTTSSGDYY